jgi:hypothetical protein
VCSGDGRSGGINDGAADVARQLRVGLLIGKLARLLRG